MRKVLLAIIFLTSLSVSAQPSYCIRIGMTEGLFDVKYQNKTLQTKPNLSLIAGFEVDMPFSFYFSARTGLNFVQKSTEINRGAFYHPDTSITALNRFNYFEAPIYLVFRLENNSGNAFYLGIGPSVAMAITGTVYTEKQFANNTQQLSEKVNCIFKKNTGERKINHFNRFDLGMGAFVAYKFGSGFTITANYTKGLTNISSHADENFSTAYLGLTLGFQM